MDEEEPGVLVEDLDEETDEEVGDSDELFSSSDGKQTSASSSWHPTSQTIPSQDLLDEETLLFEGFYLV